MEGIFLNVSHRPNGHKHQRECHGHIIGNNDHRGTPMTLLSKHMCYYNVVVNDYFGRTSNTNAVMNGHHKPLALDRYD